MTLQNLLPCRIRQRAPSIKRLALAPPSSTGLVLTRRVLAEAAGTHSQNGHPTAEELSEDIRCIEEAIAQHYSGACCGGKADADPPESDSGGGGDLEMANATGTEPSDVTIEDTSKPVRYDEAPLPVLLSALLTLDYDYTATVSHENDIAAAFRNYVSKIADAQVAHSEAVSKDFWTGAASCTEDGAAAMRAAGDFWKGSAGCRPRAPRRAPGASPPSPWRECLRGVSTSPSAWPISSACWARTKSMIARNTPSARAERRRARTPSASVRDAFETRKSAAAQQRPTRPVGAMRPRQARWRRGGGRRPGSAAERPERT